MGGFTDPIVGGISLRKPAIRSPNYLAGSTGWTINVDGSAEFNNLTIRGTFFGTNFEIGPLGAFFYSGTPATGNLIASITPASGADDGFGNAYLAGQSTYGIGAQTFSELFGGNLLLGNMASNVPDTADSGLVQAQGPLMVLRSPVNASPSLVRDAVRITLAAGQTAQTTGSANAPQIQVLANDLASDVDMLLPGSVIRCSDIGAAETWQTPSYGTGWSGSTTFNGLTTITPLRYRRDNEDNLWLIGGFKAAAVAPSDPIFQLPAAYTIKGTNVFDYVTCLRNNAGTVTAGMLRVGSNSNVDALSAINTGIAASNEYLVNGKVPLRNIS